MGASVADNKPRIDADKWLSAVRSDRDFELAVAHLEDVVRRVATAGGSGSGSAETSDLQEIGRNTDLSRQNVHGNLTEQLRAVIERVVLDFVPAVDGVWSETEASAVDDEMAHITALETALKSLDRDQWDARDKLYRELFEVRGKRIDRGNERNWKKLEQLVGHKLPR